MRDLTGRKEELHEVLSADGTHAGEFFAGAKPTTGARQQRGATNTIVNVVFRGRELRRITADGSQLGGQRVADVHYKVPGVTIEPLPFERQPEIELAGDGMHGQAIE